MEALPGVLLHWFPISLEGTHQGEEVRVFIPQPSAC